MIKPHDSYELNPLFVYDSAKNVEGNPILAIIDVEGIEEFTDKEIALMTDKIFRTDDSTYPGVAAFNS